MVQNGNIRFLDGHQLNQNIYDQRHLMTINTDEIEKMIIDKEALIHWISILPVIIFNKGSRLVKYINIFYAMIANV